MNDILIETCNYIYKNPGLSKYRYIKDMSNRSIWRYTNVEDYVDYLSQTGVLKEYKKYSSLYNKEYSTLEVNIIEYIKLYNTKFNNKAVVDILTYIYKHPKKSCKTYKNDFSNMFEDNNVNKSYLYYFLELENNNVLRLRSEYFNNYKYYSLKIDFHQLKNFIINN